ncbi:MAG: transglycosylase SLT domain-containing protein, partial [Endozoicomonas sp.]
QHKSCDPLFKSWKSAGELTQSLITARFWMAAEQNNLSLARYLDNKITDPLFKPSTSLFWKVDKNPKLLASHFFIGELNYQRTIMLHGMKKLISRDYDFAIKIWLKLREEHPFTIDETAKVDQRIALKATKNFRDDAETISAKIDPDFQYHKVTEWRVRNALADQDWLGVIKFIEKLPPAIRHESRWRYWIEVAQLQFLEETRKGKSTLTTINTLDKLKAPLLTSLSSERNFYAFLVADLKGVPFQLNHQSKQVRSEDIQKLKQYYPGLERIKEWTHHQRFYSAQQEMNLITPGLTDSQKALIPYLAQKWQWHFQSIMSAARAELWDDLDLRFPAPEYSLFSHHANKNNLDYSWVVAIARQESAFHPRARSHAGAMGLMQLMPATAKQAARQAGIKLRKNTELYKPEMNIALGTTHLSWLSKRFDNSRILATAAYNAGSTAVHRWLKQRGHLPLDIWIETIPYDETRKYVQNVMAYRVIYGQMGNQPVRMFSTKEVSSLSLNLNASSFIAQSDQPKP